ncbi:glycogen/starch synthase [Pontibacter sp. G13]|uniref:glycogen/starch synthase n=1 Tax=Pontibacter sp. G13 TaxID=3074898 RepID=UPI002889250E|nr:glycogen/starch synthase [Pontibacter sp. G13]WNJ16189.1 glycogen/starch synthase [Pontibacter sp. G13]
MDKKLRILYVTSEIDPFLKLSSAADLIRLLPQKLQEKGHEIRIFMPKFGVINERRNRLHEVVRLSGINIRVAGEEKPLTIKVASIPNAKLQVYFLDNEDYFKRKSVLKDTNDKFHVDNDERSIFFCKGVIETVKKLGWPPDIIHCHDWMTSFIPLYLRTHYQDDPMFKGTKTVYTVYNNGFESELANDYLDKMRVDGIADDKLDSFSGNNYVGVVKGGIALSDVVTKGHPNIDAKLEEYIEQTHSEKIYFDTDDKESYVEGYNRLYAQISS